MIHKNLMFKSLKKVIYPVTDLEKGKQWYIGILKVPPEFETPVTIIFAIGEYSISLFKSDQPCTENSSGMNIFRSVENIESSYGALLAAGAKPFAPIRFLQDDWYELFL